jgi:hypothetical protein
MILVNSPGPPEGCGSKGAGDVGNTGISAPDSAESVRSS